MGDGASLKGEQSLTKDAGTLLPAYLALASGLAALGFSAIFVRWAGAPGTVAAFYRMAIGLGMLTIPFAGSRRGRPRFQAREIRLALWGGAFFALDLAFWSSGVMLSGATNPTLLANTAPIWVGVGAWFILRERLPRRFWLGLALALAGATLVIGLDALQSMTLGLGTLLGLLAGLFYGGYFLITQVGRRSLSALSYFWFSALSASLLLLAINLALGQPLTGYAPRTYLSLLGLGVVSQGLGWMAINYAQGHLPATTVAPTLLGQPVLTGLLAGPLLGEYLQPLQVLGGGIVLAGIYIVHRSRQGPKGGA